MGRVCGGTCSLLASVLRSLDTRTPVRLASGEIAECLPSVSADERERSES
jgi:hypothetical protein